MLDISSELVYIMSQNECTSVYALYLLEDDKDVQHESKISTEWNNLGARYRGSKSFSVNA